MEATGQVRGGRERCQARLRRPVASEHRWLLLLNVLHLLLLMHLLLLLLLLLLVLLMLLLLVLMLLLHRLPPRRVSTATTKAEPSKFGRVRRCSER